MDNQRLFLNVKKSISDRRWVDRVSPAMDRVALDAAQRGEVPELLARILVARGVEADGVQSFLNPTLRDLMPDPSTMTDMDLAAERIAKAITDGERIAIFGDYDVDGATSSALLSRYLTSFNITNQIYIPDRIIEGYGPSPAAIKSLADEGAELIVTVDCGATSFEALEKAAELGVDVVVLDHHQVGFELPIAKAIVNPNRQDDLSGLGHLAAVGVTFMTLVAVSRLLRQQGQDVPDLMAWLDLVALGTVCDVVPLKTLNRAFVTRGILTMRQMQNRGLAALTSVARLDEPLAPYHLGFLLGPRINAGGRIGDAGLGARLLTLDDQMQATEIAGELDRLNAERQAWEAAILEEADAQATREIGEGEGPAVLITSGDDWHPGVVGIVASRLKDRYHRPSFVLAFNAAGVGTGSGRSVSGVDLGAAVREAVDEGILSKGGGHAMAAGLTVEKQKLADLRAFFEEKLKADVQEARRKDALMVDAAVTARGASLELMDMLDRAGPYGMGHPTPVFALPHHRIAYADVVGKGHVKLTLKSSDGGNLNAIAFRVADQPLGQALLNKRGEVMHFAGTLAKNTWQGRQSVQMRVQDAAEIG